MKKLFLTEFDSGDRKEDYGDKMADYSDNTDTWSYILKIMSHSISLTTFDIYDKQNK